MSKQCYGALSIRSRRGAGYARYRRPNDLDRQIDALTMAGIDPANIYVDKKSGPTTDRPGLTALLEYARDGDVIVTHTLDRLGRNVRDTLNLIHDLRERGIGVRKLADPIRIDSTNPGRSDGTTGRRIARTVRADERTYTLERAAHAREARPRRADAPAARRWSPNPRSPTPSNYGTPAPPFPRSPPRPDGLTRFHSLPAPATEAGRVCHRRTRGPDRGRACCSGSRFHSWSG
ncbi:recombinase family protein [Rhodococcus hoagii]|nr:recombinase family protein [Prescottella equi]